MGDVDCMNDERVEDSQQSDPEVGASKPRRGGTRLRDQVAALEQRVRELQEEGDKLKDLWMRAAAELENFKKRAAREREDWTKYAAEGVLKEMLPVLDNLERALNHADNQENPEALLDGIRMVHRQFLSILERFGVKSIEALNQTFDPSLHEAMMQVQSEEHDANTVVQELERGYLLHDRLLRPSRVAVSKRTEP
jgi:molecular chaperone GrpE